MPQIVWDDSFSVNNETIDEQHRQWIAIFNRMHDVMLSGTTEELSDAAVEALRAMEEYASYHFKAEEEYMAGIGYPGLVEHKRLHKDFDNLIFQMNKESESGRIVLNTSLIKTIKNWLVDHILKEDKKYCAFAAQTGKS